ncbi:N-terminal phage integrase SAM-like domain-containing protein [Micromonospora chalcea]
MPSLSATAMEAALSGPMAAVMRWSFTVPDRAWKLADYLPYWLKTYVSDLKPTTVRGYESAVRLHLVPALGTKRLDGLQVQHVKAFMDGFRRKCLCCTNGLRQDPPG